MSSNVGVVVLKLGGYRDFNEFVRMWVLSLSNPMVCSEYFVVR